MASKFFCRECGETVVWGERVNRWVHETAPNDHAIALAKRGEDYEPLVDPEPVFSDRSEMIGEALEGQNNIGSTGTLDGDHDGPIGREEWIRLRVLADQVLSLGGDDAGLSE